ncbi:flagellar biosynthetic protein FliO [Thiomicrospira sp. XS5]|uniref:flagellar biosynthetic protein FliO n=1 Tax=Thiomicrospira sp. XS5 TaxID=1775636 RepID=UPI0009EA5C10|nr:flagellar biosynthetic protein FliO [Thiomicrospira sp. XS5]
MKPLSFQALKLSLRPIHQAWSFLILALFQLPALAATAESPSLTTSLEPSNYIGQILMSLFFILLIIFAAAWMLKRFGKINGVAGNQMKVLGVMSLGQRERAVLLEVGKEQLLIGVTSSRVSLLHKLEEPIEVVTEKPVNSAFAKRLQEAIQQRTVSPSSPAKGKADD